MSSGGAAKEERGGVRGRASRLSVVARGRARDTGRVPRRKKGMLALTGRGDDGTTGLLGGGRVPKDDPRIEAGGTVDEASSALGLARALSSDAEVRSACEELQRILYRLGAAISAAPGMEGAFGTTGEGDVRRLEEITAGLEAAVPMPVGFVLPGSTPASAALDVARAVVRRAERRCTALARAGALADPAAAAVLNRMSLVLFVLARFQEAREGAPGRRAREASRPP